MPFELINRYTLDAWDDEGEYLSMPAARWFSSNTQWCNTPYRPPQETTKKEYYREIGQGAAGHEEGQTRTGEVRPARFVRRPLHGPPGPRGRRHEPGDAGQGDIRTGVSSPKRYLWADDDSWLEGANWHMADPADRCGTGTSSATLQGPTLRFVHEDDRDFLLDNDEPAEDAFAPEIPIKPRHAPRTLMMTALYEMLCQAYTLRQLAGLPQPPRRSGPVARNPHPDADLSQRHDPGGADSGSSRRPKRRSTSSPARWASTSASEPELNLSIDEASAVHLTYIWSELRMLGQDPRLWFCRRSPGPRADEAGQATAKSERKRAWRPCRRPPPRCGAGARVRRPGDVGGPAARGDEDARIRATGTAHRLHRHRRRHDRPDDRQYNFEPRSTTRSAARSCTRTASPSAATNWSSGCWRRSSCPPSPTPSAWRRKTCNCSSVPRCPETAVQFQPHRLDQPAVRPAGPGLSATTRSMTSRRAHLAHRSRDRRSGRARVAPADLRQAPRSRLLQRPAGTRPHVQQDRVRGRRPRRVRRPALRLLPADRRTRRRRRAPGRPALEARLHPAARRGCTCRCPPRGSCPCTTTTRATGIRTRTRRATTRA